MYEIIDEKVIENCELNDACDEGLNWLRKTPRTYQDLRTYRMEWFRWMAEHCTLPTVLEKLSTDTDAYVRRNIAANQQTPVTVLEKLSTDTDADVRYGVAANQQTPVTVLEKLSTDTVAYVRYGVAANQQTPVTVLEKLSTDTVADVRRNAKRTLHNAVGVEVAGE
jgi:hypothetical protein